MTQPSAIVAYECPTCCGSGLCMTCRAGSTNEAGLSCWECSATHRCGDCDGTGLYDTDKLMDAAIAPLRAAFAQMPAAPAVVNAGPLSRPGEGEPYQSAETATGAVQGAGDTIGGRG